MSSDITTIDQPEVALPEVPKDVIDAGVFYGRTKSQTNPKMKPYVLTNRNGIEIINVLRTVEDLERACVFLKEKVQGGGLVLVVGTQPQAHASVQALANELQMPFVTRRWLGGTLTNYKVILKRIEYFLKLKSDFAAGVFEKYTKKERVVIEKEIARLEELLGGLTHLTRLPEVLVVIDPFIHKTTVHEANMTKIPVIALADVNSDPDNLTFPVVGNNKARKSIMWFLGKIEQAIRDGQGVRKTAVAAAAAEAALKTETKADA
jgi:small subunit ribosomal protein S2